MEITNISNSVLYFNDLRLRPEAQNEGRRGEDRTIQPGQSYYFPNTSQVLRSAISGNIALWRDEGKITLEDTVTLAANGDPNDSVELAHPFSHGPVVYVLKQVGDTWVDATGTYDLVHNVSSSSPLKFASVTITNTTAGSLVFFVRFAD